ncbi:MAG: glycosyltransferase family 2 protein [Bacilli bacterium]|nr:glycosyltransferase family 2 protein [Bacilli bacterium]
MDKQLVTIIVPVYNSRKYLKRCIDSILGQTYKDFELIIVDDGSVDDSKKIVKSFKDKRIKYIYSKHFGVSSARNIGIKCASGDFISFIDSDDVVCDIFLERLIKKLDSNVDLSICSYTKWNRFSYTKESIVVKNDLGYKYLLNKKFGGYIWNKLFKKSIIEQHSILFSEKLTMGEDYLFVSEYLKYCNNISIDFNKYYFYRKSNEQITKRYDESISSVLYGWIGVLKIYEVYCPRVKNEIEYRYLKKLIELKKIIDHDFDVPKIKIDYSSFSLRQRIVLSLYKVFAREIVFIKKVL